MIEDGHRQGRYDAQGNVEKGVVVVCWWCVFCFVGVVVSAIAHGFGLGFGLGSSSASQELPGTW